MNLNPESIDKILCIQPRGIGDIILTTIVLDNLKKYFGEVKIDYLVEEFAKRSVEHNPIVNHVLTMLPREFPLSVAAKLRREKYNLILDFWSNPRTAQITFLSGAKYRVGFGHRGRRYAYNIITEPVESVLHNADVCLSFLNSINVPIITKNIHYYISNEEELFAKKFIEDNFNKGRKLIGLLPSGGWKSKKCEPEKWIEIGRKIIDQFDAGLLIIWGPGDEKDVKNIYSGLVENVIKAPKTSVGEMSGLINECDVIIANDSGPMHIAAALNIPTIGLFGPTDPLRHRPYSLNSDYVIKNDLHCIKCNKLECPFNHECMFEISVEEILAKAKILMNKRSNR